MDKLAYYINITGLLLDIVGVILIFFFAEPKSGFEKDPNDHSRMIPFSRPDVWGKYKNLGLFLVICGFVLQVIANWMFI